MEEYTVTFYVKGDGTSPAMDFIMSQNEKMQSKILSHVTLLAERGPNIHDDRISKALKDGIFELRAQIATDETRVLYFFVKGKKVVLTNGFVKKTQKTPPQEIETAKKYREDYNSR